MQPDIYDRFRNRIHRPRFLRTRFVGEPKNKGFDRFSPKKLKGLVSWVTGSHKSSK